MRRAARRGIVGAAIALVAVGAAYATIYRPAYLRGTQVRNVTTMRTYSAIVDHFHDTHGRFPESLHEATVDWRPSGDVTGFYLTCRDNWGTPVVYIPTGEGYLLISFGHDGRPDGSDYVALRSSGQLDNATCHDVNADQVFSDRGEHRTCGK